MQKLSRRAIVRLISYTIAVILTLSVACTLTYRRAQTAERKLETDYLRAVEALNDQMSDISNMLTKGKYANTPAMITTLAGQLKTATQSAKENLSALPLNSLHLENTYKFLSQLGEYTLSLSRKAEHGEKISDADAQNMKKLEQYCTALRGEIQYLEDAVQTGTISFREIVQELNDTVVGEGKSPAFTDGFQEYEAGFSEFPSLIYDGPFSDHLMEKEALMTKDKAVVNKIAAKETAALMTGLSPEQLTDGGDEEGHMPSYTFIADGISAGVTHQGGLPVYYLKSRTIGEAVISREAAVKAAREYLTKLKIGSLSESYYEITGNRITINFAALQEDVTLYPDLIKVTVALDNGEIIGFDARGYLTNHHNRALAQPKVSLKQARENLSPNLTVKKENMALIPTDSMKEALCYEFVCTGEDSDHILVYINAVTGEEEDILILLIDENGSLTI